MLLGCGAYSALRRSLQRRCGSCDQPVPSSLSAGRVAGLGASEGMHERLYGHAGDAAGEESRTGERCSGCACRRGWPLPLPLVEAASALWVLHCPLLSLLLHAPPPPPLLHWPHLRQRPTSPPLPSRLLLSCAQPALRLHRTQPQCRPSNDNRAGHASPWPSSPPTATQPTLPQHSPHHTHHQHSTHHQGQPTTITAAPLSHPPASSPFADLYSPALTCTSWSPPLPLYPLSPSSSSPHSSPLPSPPFPSSPPSSPLPPAPHPPSSPAPSLSPRCLSPSSVVGMPVAPL